MNFITKILRHQAFTTIFSNSVKVLHRDAFFKAEKTAERFQTLLYLSI